MKLYFSDYKGKLRYGTFDLNNGMSLGKVIKELATQDGQKENKFTIPEGYTIEMTASKLEKEGIMSAQEFLTAVTNAAVTSKYKDVLPKKKKYFISYRDIFIRIPIIYRKILPVISLWQRCSMNLIKSLIRQDRKKRKSLV